MLEAGRGSKKYKKKGNRRSGAEPIFFFLKFSSVFAVIHSFNKCLAIMYWAPNKEGVVGTVNKPGMAQLSLLTTHCLTYSIISHCISFGLPASSAYPTELSAPLTLLNVKSLSTDLAFTSLPLAMWARGNRSAFHGCLWSKGHIVWDVGNLLRADVNKTFLNSLG